MFQLSFKNRLAFNFMITTALVMFGVFAVIYAIVKYNVYRDVNSDIEHEIALHFSEMDFDKDIFKWIDVEEWKEREHNRLTIDPVFVEIYKPDGIPVEKSPNLKKDNLHFYRNIHKKHFVDTTLHRQSIRQVQVPIVRNDSIKGYLSIAMSLEEENVVLDNLMLVLIISAILVLPLLFFIIRYIAGRSIRPIIRITETASQISRQNLNLRINLPPNRDELFVLSETINSLLERIETAVDREKQFTSDASHELRTPLAVIKGNLEVLIRKPREKEEYEKTINYCISEINRMNNLVDQLLLLARFENSQIVLQKQKIALNEIILESLERLSPLIKSRRSVINFKFDELFPVTTDAYKASIIIENILSNAIKYSEVGGVVDIHIFNENGYVICRITDFGIGISKQELQDIYKQFYRAKSNKFSDVKGTGIGLSIVKKLCELLGVSIDIQSSEKQGTTVALLFKDDDAPSGISEGS
ncbi:two-component sensor histidine kinase [Flavobacterium magnum]|uniref:histidine kinase n=1 Tax=Flavobacterium magnum TaxID=2162713 RepID=A0A2S0RIG8_9FLAO|nr:ATP-binding protein [Flavobacterium magnum]AWA31484.1 two-component sensor histidine kinase [Flavobacterium magnum]